MRLIVLALAVFFVSFNAAATQPGKAVFKYECKNSDSPYFECQIESGKVIFRLMKNPENMDTKESELFNYQVSKLIVRFFSLGGQKLYRTHGYDNKKWECNLWANTLHDYTCKEVN